MSDNFTADEISFNAHVASDAARLALLRYANQLVPNDPYKAEDVVQEAILSAWKAWPRFTPTYAEAVEASIHAWLKRIVYNTFSGTLRETAREVLQPGEDVSWFERVTEPELSPAEVHADTVDQKLLQDAIRGLPAPFIASAYFYLIEKFTYAQIAQLTNVPLGTVSSQVQRARFHLSGNQAVREFLELDEEEKVVTHR